MNYVICYWAPPDLSPRREQALRRYFDLQRYTKAQFGAEQLIVTNLNYPGAIEFIEPPGFKREHALFARYFGLGQLFDQGLGFPLCVHDHDAFINRPMHARGHIQCLAMTPNGTFSEQFVIYPEAAKQALQAYIERLKQFQFGTLQRRELGAAVRHEGMYSSEFTLATLTENPFQGMPVQASISHRDLVSFDIQGHHSLDTAYCECNPINADTQVVHGHINKGPASDALFEWLAS